MNTCSKCGLEIPEGKTLCAACENAEITVPKRKVNITGIVGFALAVVGFIVILVFVLSALKGLESGDSSEALGAVLTTILLVLPLSVGVGVIVCIVSLIGLIVGIVKKRAMNGFAVAGMLIAVLDAAMAFIALAIAGAQSA